MHNKGDYGGGPDDLHTCVPPNESIRPVGHLVDVALEQVRGTERRTFVLDVWLREVGVHR